MKIRHRSLPAGWYPATESQTSAQIEELIKSLSKYSGESEAQAVPESSAGIVPHAGWSFSGKIALQVIRRIPPDTKTIVVTGGHLAPRDKILAAFEEGYETPLGVLKADLDLLEYLKTKVSLLEDRFEDNTVEVQLPLIKYFFPETRVLGLRVSPTEESIHLGQILAEAQKSLGRSIAVVGSTDLTHYGLNYGFSPKGSGKGAVKWVKEINDKRIIESLINMNLHQALERGVKEKSACSVGGAVAATSFASKRGISRGELLHYTTSYDIYPNVSFVGYAGIIFPDIERQ